MVRLTDDALFQCPILMGSDVGTIGLSDQEAQRLRAVPAEGRVSVGRRLLGHAGVEAVDRTRSTRRCPSTRSSIFPPSIRFVTCCSRSNEVEQVTNINNWLRTGSTSERGDDSPHADFRGIADDKGRIMVVMTHNTDFGDSWERESESREFFEQFSPKGYALGIDVRALRDDPLRPCSQTGEWDGGATVCRWRHEVRLGRSGDANLKSAVGLDVQASAFPYSASRRLQAFSACGSL